MNDKKRPFKVHVSRVGYGNKHIEVEATSPQEAADLADEQAGGEEFSEHTSEYEIQSVQDMTSGEFCDFDEDSGGINEPENNKKRYYKTIIQIEVLSEEEIPDGMSTTDIIREYEQGDYSGQAETIETIKLNGFEMARALEEQGSDPAFFGLDDNGEELED